MILEKIFYDNIMLLAILANSINQISKTFSFVLGIGGDAFCLYYSKNENKIQGLNASGRAPENLTLEYLNSISFNNSNRWPVGHALTVTVPGACAG